MRTTRAFELASVPLLRALPLDRLEHLAACAVETTVPAGQILLSERGAAEALYVVGRGCLALEARGLEGQRLLFGLVGPGDTLGEQRLSATASGAPSGSRSQPFTAVALKASDLLRLPLEPVRAAFAVCPDASWSLAEVLTVQVERAQRTMHWLGTMTVAQRVAAQLCELASLVGKPHPPGPTNLSGPTSPGDAITLGLHLTHDLLADLVGATRESVTRALTMFRRLGWITTGRATCVLTNPHALQRHAATEIRGRW